MKRTIVIFALGLLLAGLGLNSAAMAADNASIQDEAKIKVDIPVVLKHAKVVFDIGRVSFTGDMPFALRYMSIMSKVFKEQGVEGKIIGVFYADASYLVLNDQAYNAHRRVTTGNPFKATIEELMAQGAQLEECSNAMKMQHISNEDLLAGVKVNGGANLRMIQLMQEGFLRLQP
jgi:intracellular sulfur oxidation DsrE/DsrF family protein